MKRLLIVLLFTMFNTSVMAQSCPALLDFKFKRLQDDVTQDLCQYTGKVVLVVNTASYCGYTGQYGDSNSYFQNIKTRV